MSASAGSEATENPSGGQRFSKGALYHLLSNRIYRGAIVHKGAVHPGLNEPIIEEEHWVIVERTP